METVVGIVGVMLGTVEVVVLVAVGLGVGVLVADGLGVGVTLGTVEVVVLVPVELGVGVLVGGYVAVTVGVAVGVLIIEVVCVTVGVGVRVSVGISVLDCRPEASGVRVGVGVRDGGEVSPGWLGATEGVVSSVSAGVAVASPHSAATVCATAVSICSGRSVPDHVPTSRVAKAFSVWAMAVRWRSLNSPPGPLLPSAGPEEPSNRSTIAGPATGLAQKARSATTASEAAAIKTRLLRRLPPRPSGRASRTLEAPR
jgi:hypothetical protein